MRRSKNVGDLVEGISIQKTLSKKQNRGVTLTSKFFNHKAFIFNGSFRADRFQLFSRLRWLAVVELKDGKAVLIADKVELLQAYNQNLQRVSGINGEFTDVRIETGAQGAYALVFSGKAYKSTFWVEQADDGTVLRANDTISCTTADFTQETGGCEPMFNGGDRSYCSPSSNDGVCTKTVSSSSLLSVGSKE